MANKKQHIKYKEEQRKKAISTIKAILKKLENREMDVTNCGTWNTGFNGIAFRIDLEEIKEES